MASTEKAVRPERTSPEQARTLLASLTPREREILELVQLGLTNAEVARHLFISDGTVRKHVENAYLKLGIHSRIQAAALLSAARLLPSITVEAERSPELPRYLTSFVGRSREIAQLKDLLAAGRLLTLTGPGGVGKTRLALHLADQVSEAYDAGARFADLGGLADPALVPQAVATQLGIREQPGYAALDTLVHFLRPRRLLLVLDNCEHVLPACASLADGLLRGCPSLQIVATSRQALRIDGETVCSVPSLAVPEGEDLPPIERLIEWEAVRLMVERARAGVPSFSVNDHNAGLVVQICRRLDGIPLAVELAAALVRTRPLDLIARGLDDRFQLLVTGSRTAVPRQQTLRATVDWSYDLLTDAERTLFRRLAVFVGRFGHEAAQEVCVGDYGEVEVMDLLAGLVDKSLVNLEVDAGGTCYRLLETVRDYARQRLVAAGEDAQLRTRHRDWYLGMAERAQAHLFGGPHQTATLERHDREHDNLRAALEWSRTQPAATGGSGDGSLRLAASLWRFWEIRGYLTEGRTWLESALGRTRGEVSEMRANALTGAGIMAFMQGDYAASYALHEESLTLHRQVGSARSVALALSNLGNVAMELGDYARARSCHEEAASLHHMLGNEPEEAGASLHLADVADRMGDTSSARAQFEQTLMTLEQLAERATQGERAFVRWLLAYGLSVYATAALRHGDLALARRLSLRSLFLYRDLADGREGARVLGLIAEVADGQGDSAAAVSLLLEALSARHAMGDRPGIAATLERLAEIAARADARRAVRLLGSAEALRERMGTPLPFRDRARHEALRSSLRSSLGEGQYVERFEEGRRSSLTEAIEEASATTQLGTSGPP